VDADERGDIDALAELLPEDARLTMPPHPTWYRVSNRSVEDTLSVMLVIPFGS